MQGPVKIASFIGNAMVLLGFGLIALAWGGATSLDAIQGQLPYALARGLGGVALIIGGLAIIVTQVQRTITADRGRQMATLQAEADALIRLLIRPAPGEIIEDETIIDVGAMTVVRTIDRRPAAERRAPANGQAAGVPQAQPVGVPRLEDAPAGTDAADHEAWAPQQDDEADFAAVLDPVTGVGPAKQADLRRRFGTVAALREADEEALTAVSGISPALAQRILHATS